MKTAVNRSQVKMLKKCREKDDGFFESSFGKYAFHKSLAAVLINHLSSLKYLIEKDEINRPTNGSPAGLTLLSNMLIL